jgi:hypothetical protein
MAKNDPSGEHGKPGQCEMTIESEDSSKLILAHQNKRNAIRETHFLVRVFFKEFQGGNFVFFLGAGDDKQPGSVNVPSSFGCEQMARLTRDEGERLIQDEITGEAWFARPKNPLPCGHRLAMILVAPNVLSDKGPRHQ